MALSGEGRALPAPGPIALRSLQLPLATVTTGVAVPAGVLELGYRSQTGRDVQLPTGTDLSACRAACIAGHADVNGVPHLIGLRAYTMHMFSTQSVSRCEGRLRRPGLILGQDRVT